MSTPLTDKINALTAYANEVTGKSDTTLSEAVHTLADGYGQGGGDTIWPAIVDGTVTEIDDKDGVCKSIRAYAFYNNTSLVSANFPEATEVGEEAFNNCKKLKTVDFSRATEISINGFRECEKLQSVRFPLVETLKRYAFYYCTSLASVEMPLAQVFGESVFTGCQSLSVVDFPSAVSIGSSAFASCTGLSALILRRSDSACQLSSTGAFNKTPIKAGTGYIYVPSALIETYKTADRWSTFAAKFRALEDYTVDGTTTGDLDPTKI